MVIRTQAGAHTPPKVALLGLARSAGKLVYSISKLPFPTSTQLRQCVFPPEGEGHLSRSRLIKERTTRQSLLPAATGHLCLEPSTPDGWGLFRCVQTHALTVTQTDDFWGVLGSLFIVKEAGKEQGSRTL